MYIVSGFEEPCRWSDIVGIPALERRNEKNTLFFYLLSTYIVSGFEEPCRWSDIVGIPTLERRNEKKAEPFKMTRLFFDLK